MIKGKTGQCIDCPPGTLRTIYAKGRCQMHYWANNKLESNQKARENITAEELKAQEELQTWFQHHINNNNWICDNCGKPINAFNRDVMYSCQAHIIPKALFPSVKSNLYNHLTLCGMFQNQHCHDDYDANWTKAITMPVFDLATKRFLLFKDDIDKEELRKLPDIFKQLL